MLQAMKRGYQVTPMNGPMLCGTTAVSQRFQELRDHPGVTELITSERVPGHRYHRYFIRGAINTATKEKNAPVIVSPHVRNVKTPSNDNLSFEW
jgi:hypothetical protein